MSFPRKQWHSRKEQEVNRQPFSHWSTCSTDWVPVDQLWKRSFLRFLGSPFFVSCVINHLQTFTTTKKSAHGLAEQHDLHWGSGSVAMDTTPDLMPAECGEDIYSVRLLRISCRFRRPNTDFTWNKSCNCLQKKPPWGWMWVVLSQKKLKNTILAFAPCYDSSHTNNIIRPSSSTQANGGQPVIGGRAGWYPGLVTTGHYWATNRQTRTQSHTPPWKTSLLRFMFLVHVEKKGGELAENPHRHRKNLQTPHRKAWNQTHNLHAGRPQRQPLNSPLVTDEEINKEPPLETDWWYQCRISSSNPWLPPPLMGLE